MKKLVSCNHCDALISDTAILCPICLKTQDMQDNKNGASIGAKIAIGAVAIILPAATAGVMADKIRDSKIVQETMKLGKSYDAIDAFYVSDMLVMVTNSDFIFVLGGQTLGVDGPALLHSFTIPHDKIQEVYIDEKKSHTGNYFKSSRTYLCIRNTSGLFTACPSYEFKGKDSRKSAEFAISKFLEYCRKP